MAASSDESVLAWKSCKSPATANSITRNDTEYMEAHSQDQHCIGFNFIVLNCDSRSEDVMKVLLQKKTRTKEMIKEIYGVVVDCCIHKL